MSSDENNNNHEMLQPTIPYLAKWLRSFDLRLRHDALHALFKLSSSEESCKLMQHAGIAKVTNNLSISLFILKLNIFFDSYWQ